MKAITELSSTMDVLNKKSPTGAEYFAYSKLSKIFLSLCELDMSSSSEDKEQDWDIYKFEGPNFDKVATLK